MTLSELINVPFPKDVEDLFIVYTSFMKEKEGPFNIEGDGWCFISDKNNTPIDNTCVNDLVNIVHALDRDGDTFSKVYKILDYWNNKGE